MLTFLPAIIFAQGQSSGVDSNWIMDNIFIVLGLLTIIGVIFTIGKVMSTMANYHQEEILKAQGLTLPVKSKVKKTSVWKKMMNKMSGLIPLEKEADIQLDHDYDGIHELDNSLPPWWLYMFYGTIIWAIAYVYVFSLSDIGNTQEQEYAIEMEEAEKIQLAFLLKQANSVDETNVTAMADTDDIEEGKKIFLTSCSACHGQEGQGGVGPNMADEYWVHGGSIKDVFKTIKYGVPEKGMIAWKTQMPPTAIQQVASYILTLKGSDPPNPKAPEGEIYTE